MPRKQVTNWGNYPVASANVSLPSKISELGELVTGKRDIIARGNGRCYGDSSLSDNIVSTLKFNHFLSFDTDAATLECESGVLLSEILDVIVPQGFFLPVTPGTKFITLGGAIASDIHGKNHHSEGSFSAHILSFRLIDESGSIVECSREQNAELFWRTCGGMGLTGIIVSAKFRLKRIETSFIRQLNRKAKNLDEIIELFDAASQSTYSVAWIDCFARGRAFGRSILISGEHAKASELSPDLLAHPLRSAPRESVNVPVFLPEFALNRLSARAFNAAYYHRQLRRESEKLVHFDSFFYPLDTLTNWNRLYGRSGFLQYQFVLPKNDSYSGLAKILEKIQRSGQGAPLAVLKLLG
jgi:FAD/FMN-containing dehydrogenase